MEDKSAVHTYHFIKSYIDLLNTLKSNPSQILGLNHLQFSLYVSKLAVKNHAHLEVTDLRYCVKDFKKLYQQAHYAKVCASDEANTDRKRREYIHEGLSGSFAELDFPYNSHNRPRDKALNGNFYFKFLNKYEKQH